MCMLLFSIFYVSKGRDVVRYLNVLVYATLKKGDWPTLGFMEAS